MDGIQRNAIELLELINNLLDLSKMESGQMSIAIESVDLRRLLPEAAQNVALLLNGKKVELNWRIEDNLKRIQSDPLKIRQIFMNLLTNAIKFTDEGSITISAANADGGILCRLRIPVLGSKTKTSRHFRCFQANRRFDDTKSRRERFGPDHCQKYT